VRFTLSVKNSIVVNVPEDDAKEDWLPAKLLRAGSGGAIGPVKYKTTETWIHNCFFKQAGVETSKVVA
jgi:hypothetical protein